MDTVIVPRAGTYYSESATIPGAVADSANNLIHLYFQALETAVTPDVFSIGKATAPFTDPADVTVASTPLITPADFVTQTGISYQPGYLNITSVVKTDSIYFFGTFWDGNADHPTGDFKIFMGSSDTYDTIRNCRIILAPQGSYDLVRSPSVFIDNGLYKMIYTNGYIDNDSATTLMSAYSVDLKTWTPYAGTLLNVGASGSWEEKRVYMAQVLKKSTGTFAEPYKFPTENYGYPTNDNYTDAIKYYYSGSNFDAPPYADYTGLAYLYPQRGKEDFFVSESDTNVSVINRNTTHIINIPNATDSTTGKLKSSDWALFNSKADGSGSANYIQNKSATVGTAQTSSSFHISDSATIDKVLMVGGNTTSLYALNVNANVGVTNLAALRLYNSGNHGKEYYWQINPTSGEITHYGNGTSGNYTLSSFASGMLWQSTYWRWREAQSPFNYIFEIDGSASANAVNIVPSAGKLAIGGYTKDSTMRNNGSFRQIGNARFDAKIHAPSLAAGVGTKAVRWDAANGL
ncbi:MAG TPA: hypothetical protein PKM40_08160, partial [Bacteroidia bacterium]|nr:hypothetical protein [Bacteroidia bacterium]